MGVANPNLTPTLTLTRRPRLRRRCHQRRADLPAGRRQAHRRRAHRWRPPPVGIWWLDLVGPLPRGRGLITSPAEPRRDAHRRPVRAAAYRGPAQSAPPPPQAGFRARGGGIARTGRACATAAAPLHLRAERASAAAATAATAAATAAAAAAIAAAAAAAAATSAPLAPLPRSATGSAQGR